ncbi:magnesium/cobalt transporter CorA [candidate division GN15 bacterium]|nr:magnesium/cobalt transporter CorA [candidate division GN15 bacterium]
MARLYGRDSRKKGMMPGSVVYVGKERTEPIDITVTDYTANELRDVTVENVEDVFGFRDSDSISWINVSGIHDAVVVQKIGEHFGIHPLVLEDIVNAGHRPKFEDGTDYLFAIIKMLDFTGSDDTLTSEQVSVVWGESWVITFQELPGDVLDSVRQRLRRTIPRVRFMDSDYLAYALLDTIVDHYFMVLEQLGERIELLEDDIAERPAESSLATIREIKHQLVFMRKVIWPLREAVAGLDRTESRLLHSATRPYLRDLYEHVIQVIDTVETFRDMVGGLLDLYHTGVSNRMNEIMKVLTIFASIFIPLGFLAGVYGMNFDTGISDLNMPELTLPFGYILFWGIAIAIAGGLLWYFRRQKWL